jgi:hypothetical protein
MLSQVPHSVPRVASEIIGVRLLPPLRISFRSRCFHTVFTPLAATKTLSASCRFQQNKAAMSYSLVIRYFVFTPLMFHGHQQWRWVIRADDTIRIGAALQKKPDRTRLSREDRVLQRRRVPDVSSGCGQVHVGVGVEEEFDRFERTSTSSPDRRGVGRLLVAGHEQRRAEPEQNCGTKNVLLRKQYSQSTSYCKVKTEIDASHLSDHATYRETHYQFLACLHNCCQLTSGTVPRGPWFLRSR